MTNNLFNGVNDVFFVSYIIHHSHVASEVVGYAHYFCNKKTKENQNMLPVFAHNLFSFDFLFVSSGVQNSWILTGNSLANAQYANIGLQVKFMDIIKYYQQSLSSLTKSANENEKKNRKNPQDLSNLSKIYQKKSNVTISF